MKSFEGSFDARDLRVAIVVARFNETICRQLLDGAVDCLRRHGAPEEAISVTWVPGAFELPVAVRRWTRSGEVDAVVALGAVIRGDTPHFDYVAGGAASGIARAAEEDGVPVTFGVLTTDTVEQAEARAGGKAGNKGFEAALAAIEMANLLAELPKEL
ncbi:MAG TPA: 6,7-dimethyl-8-ribityllumazine synthase [Actinomycetota bacterium]|jgi:6,7-dimethyl-8-ribityllumazine synthase|nr:6,7-dimethyl-8-ribityllumazine synthase [Actinomycetota bacterium]